MTTTDRFILDHADDDIRQLALSAAKYPDVDMTTALAQIDGRQRARLKLPTWAATDGIRYPVHLSMEQCSSEQTATYKARVARRLTGGHGGRLVDLTGGFGVDCAWMGREFAETVYVERQQTLCDIAAHNFTLLGSGLTTVVCADGADYLTTMAPADMIFIDPARRDANGGRVVAISDCTPDVLAMKGTLLDRGRRVMVKLSPMLDWHKAVDDMDRDGRCVKELHIVAVDNECKELLLVLDRNLTEPLHIYCVNNDDVTDYTWTGTADMAGDTDMEGAAFVFEPNASIMKAGCFDVVEQRYGVRAIGRNSHLFVADSDIADFPGRRFAIDRISTLNKRELKENLTGMDRANITVRNFPMTVDALRKRLKLKEGGDRYVFATTRGDREHLLLICRKV